MNRRAAPARGPILILLTVMVVAGLLVGRFASDGTPGADAAHPLDVMVPAASALSTSWYCAGGTSAPGGAADETIVLGNVGTGDATATITVTSGDTNTDPTTVRTSRTRDVTIAAHSSMREQVSSILAAAEVGVMVESRGGQLVVEQEVTGSGDVSLGPCAREASNRWAFASGSTEKGARDWIAIYNPFNDGAKVDITSYSLDYSETPNAPQLKRDVISSIAVDPRHETVVELSSPDALGRRDQVGVVVHASEGTVVATRRLQFEQFSFPPAPAAGQPAAPVYRGLALGLGAPGPSGTWVFPEGPVGTGLRETIDILNPGATKATAQVDFQPVGVARPVTLTVELPPHQVTRVDPTSSVQGVPAGSAAGTAAAALPHTTVVQHRSGPAIFVEQMLSGNSAPTVGITATFGLTRASTRWAFVPGRLDAASLDGLRIFNPSGRAVTMHLEAYQSGSLVPLGPASRTRLAADGVWKPSLDGLGVPADAVLVVVADAPVYGARADVNPGFTVGNGVPFPGPSEPQ
ncbi:MAG: hypothetical protein JWL73_2650 [Actinomycetia bacterium]|nr:hypothetical protein [Actinomycetes bacterium]